MPTTLRERALIGLLTDIIIGGDFKESLEWLYLTESMPDLEERVKQLQLAIDAFKAPSIAP